MQNLFRKLQERALYQPSSLALVSGHKQVTNLQLSERIDYLAHQLQQTQLKCVALYMDNSIEWIVADLAAMQLGLTLIPIPLFFSPQQVQHLINDAGIQAVITQPELCEKFDYRKKHKLPDMQLLLLNNQTKPDVEQLKKVAKITYTSGSTGSPKGVCLSASNLGGVTKALAQGIDNLAISHHLCVMPLATLLENIAGVYVPLLMGSSIQVEPLSKLGFTNSSGFDAQQFMTCVEQSQPHSVILLPQLLMSLIELKQEFPNSFASLRFAAVGGGKSAQASLEKAHQLGLPVYEGYGLSECASVVSLNNPFHNKPGSVGKVLPHAKVRISEEGEIIVSGQSMLGYLGQGDLNGRKQNQDVHTGDLGHIDNEGFLYISGRKKNLIVSSFGRNISPEWVESEIQQAPQIAQVAIFGDAKPWLSAVVTPHKNSTKEEVEQVIQDCNQRLPDYAQIKSWLVGVQAFTAENKQLTENGRLRRETIFEQYQGQLEQLYACA